MSFEPINFYDRVAGLLLGTAVGDSIGLPREGLSKDTARRFSGTAPLGHEFLFGKGMISDDTEHACMTAQALLQSRFQSSLFARSLAWRLRFWLLGIPAGVGLATLKSILKLWMGFPPHKSGVHSAGNGPAMRSGVIGLLATDHENLCTLVKASTLLTHRDERAFEGALAIALACRYASDRTSDEIDPDTLFALLYDNISNPALRSALFTIKDALDSGKSAEQTAGLLGLDKGVNGYIIHTVAMSLFCWLNHKDDFRTAIEEVILLGGDTDTTAAITGALAGASMGAEAIPAEWLKGVWEWPRSIHWMEVLAKRLADSRRGNRDLKPIRLFWPGLFARNILFTTIVLLHGALRLLHYVKSTIRKT